MVIGFNIVVYLLLIWGKKRSLRLSDDKNERCDEILSKRIGVIEILIRYGKMKIDNTES